MDTNNKSIEGYFSTIDTLNGIHFVNFEKKELKELESLLKIDEKEKYGKYKSKQGLKYFYKYGEMHHVISSLNSTKPYLFFQNPTKWDDPFEKYFIEATYASSPFPLKEKLVCTCLTANKDCESQWLRYSDNLCLQMRLNANFFLKSLMSFTKSYDIYVGKINYCIQTDILSSNISDVFDICYKIKTIRSNDLTTGKFKRELQILLLLLKRNAFAYEKEIRIIMIPKKKRNLIDPIKIYLPLNTICEQVTISPKSGPELRGIFKNALKQKVQFSHLYTKIHKHNF